MSDSVFGGIGRPKKDEARARKSHFLCLIADGMDAEAAAKESRIDPWRALRIVTEQDFLEVVAAIRAGSPPVAVVVEANQPPASLAA